MASVQPRISIWVKIVAPTKLFVPQEGASCDQEFMGSNAPGCWAFFFPGPSFTHWPSQICCIGNVCPRAVSVIRDLISGTVKLQVLISICSRQRKFSTFKILFSLFKRED